MLFKGLHRLLCLFCLFFLLPFNAYSNKLTSFCFGIAYGESVHIEDFSLSGNTLSKSSPGTPIHNVIIFNFQNKSNNSTNFYLGWIFKESFSLSFDFLSESSHSVASDFKNGLEPYLRYAFYSLGVRILYNAKLSEQFGVYIGIVPGISSSIACGRLYGHLMDDSLKTVKISLYNNQKLTSSFSTLLGFSYNFDAFAAINFGYRFSLKPRDIQRVFFIEDIIEKDLNIKVSSVKIGTVFHIKHTLEIGASFFFN